MDLDRLHDDYLEKLGIGAGRTYDMLLTVVQHADWPDVSPLLVVCAHARDVAWMMQMMAEISHDMQYSSRVLAHGWIRIDTTLIVFRPSSSLRNNTGYAKVFEDHFVTEVYDSLHRMYPAADREAFRPPPLSLPKVEW